MDLTREVIQTIVSLGQSSRAQVIDGPAGEKHVVIPDGFKATRIDDGEKTLFRIKQAPTFGEAASFIDYVNRFKTARTVMFATTEPKARIQAVIDFHGPSEPDYCAHVAHYHPAYSEEWDRWTTAPGMPQTAFAEFVEENRRDIVKPDAALLLDIITKFKASRKQDYDSVVYQADGTVSIAWSEKTENAGRPGVAVPTELELGIPVFFKGPRYRVPVFMRYRLDAGKLTFSLKVDRADYIETDAFDAIVASVREATGVPLYIGTP